MFGGHIEQLGSPWGVVKETMLSQNPFAYLTIATSPFLGTNKTPCSVNVMSWTADAVPIQSLGKKKCLRRFRGMSSPHTTSLVHNLAICQYPFVTHTPSFLVYRPWVDKPAVELWSVGKGTGMRGETVT